MRIIYATLIALTVLFSPTLQAQAPGKVSLADVRYLEGAWVLDVARSGLTEAEAERRVVTLGPAWLRVDLHRPKDTRPTALIYNLDGSTNVNAYGAGTAVTKLTRDGEHIVLETLLTVNNQAVTLRERVPLVPGLELPIEVMLRVEHGYQGVPPAGDRVSPNVSTAKKIFRKEP